MELKGYLRSLKEHTYAPYPQPGQRSLNITYLRSILIITIPFMARFPE